MKNFFFLIPVVLLSSILFANISLDSNDKITTSTPISIPLSGVDDFSKTLLPNTLEINFSVHNRSLSWENINSNPSTVTPTGYEFHFNTDGDKEGWKNYSSVNTEVKDGILILRTTTNAGYTGLVMYNEREINTANAEYTHIVFKTDNTKLKTVRIRNNNQFSNPEVEKSVTQYSNYKTYDFNLKNSSPWTGTVNKAEIYFITDESTGFTSGEVLAHIDKIIFNNSPFLAPEQLSYSASKTVATQGAKGNSVSPTINWHNNPNREFSIQPPTQGISIDKNSGIISWDANLPNGKYNLTVTASSTTGSVTTIYSIRKGLLKPSDLGYQPNTSTFEYNETGNSVSPTIDWNGEEGAYTVSPVITGISINNSGVIRWESNLFPGTYPLTITASNTIGVATTTYTVVKNSSLNSLKFTPDESIQENPLAGNSVTPTINWNTSTGTFELNSPTAEITIDPNSGQINWTASLGIGTYVVTVTAKNTIGSFSVPYTIKIGYSEIEKIKQKYLQWIFGDNPDFDNNQNLSDRYYATTHRPTIDLSYWDFDNSGGQYDFKGTTDQNETDRSDFQKITQDHLFFYVMKYLEQGPTDTNSSSYRYR